ncbi:hypothetical protein [Fontivita pretiosa]|uniref:hypothetical protein n=1 Tax=Fontivita pretiosa TaxID=2989684 RepID=UPI003D165468
MTPQRQSALGGLVLAAGVLLGGGCQSTGRGDAAAGPATQAVACTQCQTTWVKVPQTSKGRIVGYSMAKKMVCPECRSAVENFFATGKLKHTCSICGQSLMTCEVH